MPVIKFVYNAGRLLDDAANFCFAFPKSKVHLM